MKEGASLLLQFLGDTPETRVIDFMMENYLFEYLKKEIAEGAGISRVTLHRFFSSLVEKGIVVETRRIGRGRFYKINKQNEIVKKLYAIDAKLIEDFSKELESKQKILDKISA